MHRDTGGSRRGRARARPAWPEVGRASGRARRRAGVVVEVPALHVNVDVVAPCAASQTSRTGAPTSGRVGVVVVGAEAEPPVVGDEARVALGHRRLDGLEVGVGQRRRGDAGFARACTPSPASVRADLFEVDRQHLVAEAERRRAARGRSRVRPGRQVARRRRSPGDAVRVDLPVVEREDAAANRYSTVPSSLREHVVPVVAAAGVSSRSCANSASALRDQSAGWRAPTRSGVRWSIGAHAGSLVAATGELGRGCRC